MAQYTKLAMRLFYPLTETVLPYFSDLKLDLKKSDMKISLQEYLSRGMLLTFIVFAFELSILSVVFVLIFKNFLAGFFTSITITFFLTAIFFLSYTNYPKVLIRSKSKDIENHLPFASLHLATIASSKLSLNKIIQIFSKFAPYGEFTNEIKEIESDTRLFGLDVNTALERAIERTPSKGLKELLWGILSTSRSGGDLGIYLKEKSKSFMAEYRRKLYEFSHQLTVYIEIFLTSIILGAVFFVILTSIMSGISGTAGNTLVLQFFLIFVFLPLISAVFIFLIKNATPGGE
jgi:flagellar protein FlaJ